MIIWAFHKSTLSFSFHNHYLYTTLYLVKFCCVCLIKHLNIILFCIFYFSLILTTLKNLFYRAHMKENSCPLQKLNLYRVQFHLKYNSILLILGFFRIPIFLWEIHIKPKEVTCVFRPIFMLGSHTENSF